MKLISVPRSQRFGQPRIVTSLTKRRQLVSMKLTVLGEDSVHMLELGIL